jgi:hypothetical protein
VSCLTWWCSSSRPAAHWVAVVLTTPQPSHGDYAACKQLLCLLPRLDLILSLAVLCICYAPLYFVPPTICKRTDAHLVKYTQWCNGKIICPSLRVKSLTPNLLLCFFVLYFCRLHLMKIQKINSMKIIRYSLVLGFFLFISDVIFFLCNKYVKTMYWCIISIKYYFYLFYILFPFLLFN